MFCFVNQVPETNSANLLSAQKHTRHCLPNWSFLWKFSLINQQYYQAYFHLSFFGSYRHIHLYPSHGGYFQKAICIVDACLPCITSQSSKQCQYGAGYDGIFDDNDDDSHDKVDDDDDHGNAMHVCHV